MTSKSSDSFTKALDRFRDTLTDEQKNDFSVCSLKDVESAISNIQTNYGQRKQLRNMNRLAKFLEGMQQIEELVTVFLNVHEVVAFVWGPIKFALNIAKNKLESFEVLLDTYVEIGEAIPGLRQYEQIFKDYSSVREVLERCFYDILEFHKAALEVFTRTGWRKYFEYAWKAFKTRFKPILDSLRRHKALLSDEKLTATIAEVQAGRVEAQMFRLALETRFDELSRQLKTGLEDARNREARVLQESLLQKRHLISSKLAAGNYEADQQLAFARWCTSLSEDWVLRHERFKSWLQLKTDTSRMLYIHGMPGAGKTTLVSRIIDYLLSQKTTLKGPVLFFYFKSREQDKRSMGDMLRACLNQLIHQDDNLVELLYPKCCSFSDSELRTLSTLTELLEDCILTPRSCTIVLDGLDECQDDQRNTWEDPMLIINWINNTLIPEFLRKGYSSRFLISSQHVEFLEKELARHPSIRLDQDAGHLRNIQVYTQSRASNIERRFGLSKPETEKLAQKVSAASNGFFLYARVVFDNLMDQGSNSELEEELETENFPEDLEAAYERVAIRVLDRGSKSKKASALKIFGWMICAPRPLSWVEIQSRFCIDPELGHCDAKRRRVDSCKTICSSLVEEEDENESSEETPHTVVRFVHNTAGRYLLHTGRIRLIEQHVDTALFCSRYLSSLPLQQELPFEAIEKFALSGYYGFLGYVVASWIHHLSCALRGLSSPPTKTLSDLLCSAARIFQSYETWGSNSPSSQTKTQDLHAMIADWSENGSQCRLEKRASIIRGVIESICISKLDGRVRTIFLELSGPPSFKCTKSDCRNFNIGFLEAKDRDSHLNNHERPFKCLIPGCYFEIIGLRSQRELQNHSKSQHPEPDQPLLFPKPTSTSKSTTKEDVGIFDACVKGDLDFIKAYLDQGGDVNKLHPSQPYLTPLVMAARHGQTLACGLLIDYGATQIFSYNHNVPVPQSTLTDTPTAILESMKHADYGLFWYLIHKTSQQQKEEFTLRDTFFFHLKKATYLRDDQIFGYFLSLYESTSRHRGKGHLDPGWLLHFVISETTSVSKLAIALEWAFSTTVKNHTHLSMTSPEAQFTPLIRLVDSTGNTMLHIACKCANLPIARFLLRHFRQEDINKANDQGRTPLCEAVLADQDDTDMMELLIVSDKGAAVNTEDKHGRLPLHSACFKKHQSKVELLIRYTKDLNSEDRDGNTPLLLAINSGDIKIVQILLETGRVDMMRPDRPGDTAVDHATRAEAPFNLLGLFKQHKPSVLTTGSVTTYLSGFLAECIATSLPRKLAPILKLHPTWLIRRLLKTNRIAIAKACLSVRIGFIPTDEMLDVWKLVKDEDIELRVLVLLQGTLPQDVWWEQLPDVKSILEPHSTPEYLLHLLTGDSRVRQTLLRQAEVQNDERLRNLVLQHDISEQVDS